LLDPKSETPPPIGQVRLATVGLGPVILPLESHPFAIESDEPAAGNRDPVGVAGQLGEHGVGFAKRPLGLDHAFALPPCG
jgi:hypothetical protein